MIGLKKLKLKHQLIILIAISIMMIVVVQLFYYYRFYTLTQERSKVYTGNIMKKVKETLQFNVQNSKDIAYMVAYNKYIQEYLVSQNQVRRIELMNITNDIFKYISSSNKNIYNILIIDQFDRRLTLTSGKDYSLFNDLNQKYGYLDSNFKKPVFSTVLKNREDGNFYYSYMVPVYSVLDGDSPNYRIGACVILYNANPIIDSIKKIDMPQNSLFVILDKDRNIVASNNQNAQTLLKGLRIPQENDKKSNKFLNEYDTKKTILQMDFIDVAEWSIISMIPVNELMSDMKPIRQFGILVGIIMTVLLLLIGMFFIRGITRPIAEIVNFMNSFGRKTLNKRLFISDKNELGQLSDDINKMLDKNERMTQKIINIQTSLFKAKLAKKQAQLDGLQSQINPHFLYNTLDCLKSIGLIYDVTEVVQISTSMAKIFRYCIKEADYVKVKDEIGCVKDYFNIMCIRFVDRFRAEINIDEGIMECKMLKMIFQPIVENAIYHGLEHKSEGGLLKIEGSMPEGKYLKFQISDDGKGMTLEELEILNMDLNRDTEKETMENIEKRSIGLLNINSRIKLAFGKKYGITITSLENEGTMIIITLPVLLDN